MGKYSFITQEELRSLLYYQGAVEKIQLNSSELELRKALSSRPHFFLKRRGYEKNKEAVKRSNLILRRKRSIIFLFIILCSLIRYTYSDNWELPVWIVVSCWKRRMRIFL